MKKTILALLSVILLSPMVTNAQTVITNSFDGWTGNVGKREQGVPTDNNLQMTFTHAEITTGAALIAQNGGGGARCQSTAHDSQLKPFMLNEGTDASGLCDHVNIHRAPTGFTSAIRLGYFVSNVNTAGDDKTAARLYRPIYVTEANSMLTLQYACVFMNPTDGTNKNQIAAFRVVKGTGGTPTSSATTTWETTPATTKATIPLSHIVVAPQLEFTRLVGQTTDTLILPSGWQYSGTIGSNTDCDNRVYCDYQTIKFDLREFIGSWVRLECFSSFSSDGQHGSYVYFVGSLGPTNQQVVECNPGENPPTFTMTPGLSNYVWYRSTEGYTGDLSGFSVLDTALNVEFIRVMYPGATQALRFQKVTPDSSLNNVYNVQQEDFVVSSGPNMGDPLNSQVFIGRGTCSKGVVGAPIQGAHETYPVFYVARVNNKKPTLVIDTLFYCNAKAFLDGHQSYATIGEIDNAQTHWDIFYDYNPNAPLGAANATVYADTVTFQFPRAGLHAVRLSKSIVGESNCRNEKIYPINIRKSPEGRLVITPTDHPCPGAQTNIAFNTSATIDDNWTFDWTYTNGTEDGVTEIRKVFELAEDPVRLEVTNGTYVDDALGNRVYCKTTIDTVIKVFLDPEVVADGDTVICSGEQLNFKFTVDGDDGTGMFSYQWYKDANCEQTAGAAGPTLRAFPTATPDNQQKTYYMRITNTQQGCVTAPYPQEFTILTVGLTPVEQFVCSKAQATLTAYGADSYDWSPAITDPNISGVPNAMSETVNVNPTADVTYTVTGHGVNGCTTQPASAVIHVVPYPKQSFIYDPQFIDAENPTMTFRDQSTPLTSTEWVFEGVNTLVGQQVEYTFQEVTGDSTAVLLRSTNAVNIGLPNERACTSDTLFQIAMDKLMVYIPNAFTPRLSNENRLFKLYTVNPLEHFAIYIYNRAGQLVFTSKDQDFAWDGTYNGEICPQGNYTYVLRFRRPHTDSVITKQGSLLLLW